MTLWLWLPRGLDSETVAREALRRGVALSAGTTFCVDGGGRDGLRLCFIRESEERIREGVERLAETIREMSTRLPAREQEGAAAPIL
jgi:2-aminoadipate transaminase